MRSPHLHFFSLLFQLMCVKNRQSSGPYQPPTGVVFQDFPAWWLWCYIHRLRVILRAVAPTDGRFGCTAHQKLETCILPRRSAEITRGEEAIDLGSTGLNCRR
ncbi:hypothetical protein EDC01DRAFT_669239 [Geopyxis carbonaria]|nr:hypothetical protein EDC01DRAFT_669239 [Geopyxis carbonaria]